MPPCQHLRLAAVAVALSGTTRGSPTHETVPGRCCHIASCPGMLQSTTAQPNVNSVTTARRHSGPGNPDLNASPDSLSNVNPGPYLYGNSHDHTNAQPDGYRNPDHRSDADSDSPAHSHAISDLHSVPNVHAATDAYSIAIPDTHAHIHTYAKTYGYTVANSYADSGCNAHSHSVSNINASPNADRGPSALGME